MKSVSSVQDGLVAIRPVTIIGSFYLIIAILGSPVVGSSGKPLLPFLEPCGADLSVVTSMTLGFLGLFASYTIANKYAHKLDVDAGQAGLMSLIAFFMISFNGPTDGHITVANFGATGIFVAIISSLIVVRVYKFLVDRKIVMVIRTVIGFGFPRFLTGFLTPLISAADNIWVFMLLIMRSKNKGFRSMGAAALPAGVFHIIEPVMFGLPVVLNPYLMIPFILSGTLGTVIPYFLTQIDVLGRAYASVPWATPPFINGIVTTGDWKILVGQVAMFFLGLVIDLPLFKLYERAEEARAAAENSGSEDNVATA